MADGPDWKQYLEAGMHFTAVTRAEARKRAKELVREGKLAQSKAKAFADALVDTSKQRTDEVRDVVRAEFQKQVKALGLATRDDVARLDAKIAKVTAKKPSTKKSKGAKKTAKKTAKKSTAPASA